METGDRIIRHVNHDFDAPVHAHAWDGGKGGHAIVDGSKSIEIADTWIGGFTSAGGGGADLLLLTTPDGSTKTCTCTFTSF